MESAKITFGRRLRVIRKARKMTLEALGKAASLGYKHIADIERGEKVPSFEAIDRLAKALHVQPFEFFLPLGADQANVSQSLKQVMGQIDKHSSPSVKRFLIVLLSLVRGLETDLPESVKNAATDSLHARKLLGPITIIGDLEAADTRRE